MACGGGAAAAAATQVQLAVSLPDAEDGEEVAVIGSCAALGAWDSSRAVPLARRSDGSGWEVGVELPQEPLAYKYITRDAAHQTVRRWEALPGNRYVWPGARNAAAGCRAGASSCAAGSRAGSAVDGSVFWDDERCWVSCPEAEPWWEVDLGMGVDILGIVVHLRLLSHAASAADPGLMHLLVADTPFPAGGPAPFTAAFAHARHHHQWFLPSVAEATERAATAAELDPAARAPAGRHVRVLLQNPGGHPRPLHLHEVQVFARAGGGDRSETSVYDAGGRQVVDDGEFGRAAHGPRAVAGDWLCPASGGELRLLFAHGAAPPVSVLNPRGEEEAREGCNIAVSAAPEALRRGLRRLRTAALPALRGAGTGRLPRPLEAWTLRLPPGPLRASLRIDVREGGQYGNRDEVGSAHLVPAQLAASVGDHAVPLVRNGEVAGTLRLRHVLTRPHRHRLNSLAASWHGDWRGGRPLNIGHRGVGKSFAPSPGFRPSLVVENTLASFLVAGKMRSDFVEFDVQLSQDRVPVVYHDFTLRGVVAEQEDPDALYSFNIAELSLRQLAALRKTPLPHGPAPRPEPRLRRLLRLYWHHILDIARQGGGATPASPASPPGTPPAAPHGGARSPSPPRKRARPGSRTFLPPPVPGVPTLRELFLNVPAKTGFNVEIKWPIEVEHQPLLRRFWDMNEFVDRILDDVFAHGGSRSVCFSSFDADVCTMLALKQARHKVLFLTCSGSDAECYTDARCQSLEAAAAVAVTPPRLHGVVSYNPPLLRNPPLVAALKGQGLLVFTWGDHTPEDAARLKAMGVDAVIADNIGDITSVTDIVAAR